MVIFEKDFYPLHLKTMEKKDYIPIDDLEIYQLAMEIGDCVWAKVELWDWFGKQTLGAQVVRSADSIASNIAEGYGRYFFKERRQLTFYARGSLLETKTWATKALRRKLMTQEEHDFLIEKLQALHYKINVYLKKLKQSIATQ